MKPVLLCGLLVHAALAAQPPLPVAADTGKVALSVECFAGPVLQIPVAFIADPQAPQAWFADAYLDGGKLGVPLAKAIPFTRGPAGSSPYLANGWFLVSLPVAVPAKPIVLRLILTAGPTGAERQAVGSVVVRVTPRDFLRQALAARLGDPERPLGILVFGPAPGPRDLLTAWRIPYQDAGPNPPGTAPAAMLLLGETADLARLPAPTPGASLFVLTSDPRQEADTEIRDLGGALVTLVRPAAADWNTDPRLHRLLAAHLARVSADPDLNLHRQFPSP